MTSSPGSHGGRPPADSIPHSITDDRAIGAFRRVPRTGKSRFRKRQATDLYRRSDFVWKGAGPTGQGNAGVVTRRAETGRVETLRLETVRGNGCSENKKEDVSLVLQGLADLWRGNCFFNRFIVFLLLAYSQGAVNLPPQAVLAFCNLLSH